jgi:hypothetical protein
MGYVFATSPCMGCDRVFNYNPMRVPSCVDPRTGTKEPICEICVARVNPLRIANGLEPIVPLPGAYDACDEAELG